MSIPATEKIQATFPIAYTHTFTRVQEFEESLKKLDAALTAGQIWNTEYQDWTYWIKQACEHAQHVASDGVSKWDNGNTPTWPEGDPRWDIGYAFQPNQAAPLLKRLKKLPAAAIVPGIQNYMDVLAEIAGVWTFLQQFKAIIVKGRKPNPNHVEPDVTNTGSCSICGKLQKLSAKQGMVDHGFQISNGVHYYGQRVGHCFGVGYKPYELSNEGNIAFIQYLETGLKNIEARLVELNAGTVESLPYTVRTRKGFGEYNDEHRTAVKGTPEYDRELKIAIQKGEQHRDTLKSDIKFQTEYAKNWTLKPLPHGGPKTSGFEAKMLIKQN